MKTLRTIRLASILAVCAWFGCIAVPRGLAQSSPVYPQQEGYIDANGVMLYYVTFGSGEPLVIMHGGPGASHDYFLPYLLPLARHNRLIFLDERGSGRSQKLEDRSQYTVENMVEDLEAVRKGLNLGKIICWGIPMGERWCRPMRSNTSRISRT